MNKHPCCHAETSVTTPPTPLCCSTKMSQQKHHSQMLNSIFNRFLISLGLTLPILLLSPMTQTLLGFRLAISGSVYILFLFTATIYLFCGYPFLKGLYQEIRSNSLGMMTLVGIAITVAFFYSTLALFGFAHEDFFLELVVLIDVMLLGRWIEKKSVLKASQSLELLISLMPQFAHLVSGNQVQDVNLTSIQKNDIVLIKPGEKVPCDGVIIEGASYFNESLLTGESKPVKKTIGCKVVCGAINENGSVKVQVTQTGSETYLAQVIALVKQAQAVKSKTQGLADQAAKWLTLVSLVVGLSAFIIWLALGKEFAFALERLVTVLVISCPCALGLAVPLVVAISTTVSAQHGFLIRNRTAFENARKITTLVFDKTGTLTEGNFSVVRYDTVNPNYTKAQLLAIAASIELHSEHPIALGIVTLANDKGVAYESITNFQAISGIGVTAQLRDKNVKIISPKSASDSRLKIPTISYVPNNETLVYVIIDEEIIGYFILADRLRTASFAAITHLRKNHIKTVMLTGDNSEVAKIVSTSLGIDNYFANVLPHQKLNIIKKLQQQGEYVAMAGDGINDAPAITQANIGIAMGSGTDVAIESADIVLTKSNLAALGALIQFGKLTYRKIVQNLLWAAGYNVVTIPLAAGILSHYKIGLSPIAGAVLMTLSSVVVSINAQLLKKQLSTYGE